MLASEVWSIHSLISICTWQTRSVLKKTNFCLNVSKNEDQVKSAHRDKSSNIDHQKLIKEKMTKTKTKQAYSCPQKLNGKETDVKFINSLVPGFSQTIGLLHS